MNITEINLQSYDLNILEYAEANDPSMIPARQFRVKFGASANPDIDKLFKDMMIMNTVRGSASPAVKEAYEQLLTVMALTDT